MRFGSVCSGIEAASVAFGPLGWQAAWFSEIEPFPCAVLAHHYPAVPNVGDMTCLPRLLESGRLESPPVLCGGTPCQAFSLAGQRKSLDDDRGNLSLVFCQIADAIDSVRAARGEDPCIILWENVPGVLNTNDNAFGCFLAELAGERVPLVASGGKWSNAGYVLGPTRAVAWRVLDAEHFGVAQRRRRVFVVASARDGFDPGQVLFEREGVRRDHAPAHPQREASWWNGNAVAQTLDAVLYKGQMMPEKNRFPVVAVGERSCSPPTATTTEIARIAALTTPSVDVLDLLRTISMSTAKTVTASCGRVVLRRLMPSEAERLMGFSGDHTAIPTKVKRLAPPGSGPCAKQTVTATIVAENGAHFVATNHCLSPQPTCARAGMPTGVGYELCKSVCQQPAHAEVNAVRFAGKHARGGTLYIEGHTYACDDCTAAVQAAGVTTVVLGKPPGNAADGPRYKAIGNSWAVPVVRWIANRIERELL